MVNTQHLKIEQSLIIHRIAHFNCKTQDNLQVIITLNIYKVKRTKSILVLYLYKRGRTRPRHYILC